MAMANAVNFFKDITVQSVYDCYVKTGGTFTMNGARFSLSIANIIAEASNNYLSDYVHNMSNEPKSPSEEDDLMDCDVVEFMDFNKQCSLECNNVECNYTNFILEMSTIGYGYFQFKVHSINDNATMILHNFLQSHKIDKVEFAESAQSQSVVWLTSGRVLYSACCTIALDGSAVLQGDHTFFIEKQKGSKDDKVGTLLVLEPAKCVDDYIDYIDDYFYDNNSLDDLSYANDSESYALSGLVIL